MRRKALAFFTIVTVLLSFLPAFFTPTPAYAASAVLSPSKDTYISGYPSESTNHGTDTDLLVGTWTYGFFTVYQERERTLVEFPKPWGAYVPTGSTITSAWLQLYYYSYDKTSAAMPDPAGESVLVQRLLRTGPDPWLETHANWDRYIAGSDWNTAGAAGSGTDYTTTSQASTAVPPSYGWIWWNVTDQVEAAKTSNIDIAFRITAPTLETQGTVLQFYSGAYPNSTYWPRLVINYAPPSAPTVGTIGVDTITYDSAICYGKIISEGTTTPTIRGFKYGLNQVDTWDIHEGGSFGTGDYSLNLTSLIPDSTYYFRAYATNTYGTSYGSWESFSTGTGVPIVTTGSAYVYGYGFCLYASMSGAITNTGDSTVFRRGFEWGTNPITPEYDAYETGTFSTGDYTLTNSCGANLTYWFRAYATNSEGTGYGVWKKFGTPEGPSDDCSGGGGANVTGSGTVGDPYVIWTIYGLQEMQSHLSSYWELGCNINATETSSWNGGDGFVPVGTFSGHFDGNYHAIIGLYEDINVATSCVFGLFATIQGATIQNLYILDADLSGYATGANVNCFGGILAGMVAGATTVSRVFASGALNVDGDDTYSVGQSISTAGGIIGWSNGGLAISQSASSADATAIGHHYTWAYGGGLVGYISTQYYGGATISNCYARGNAYGSRAAGGLIGQTYMPYSSITTDNCYSTGTVSGTYPNFSGGLKGYTNGAVTDSFWDTQTSLMSGSHGGTGKVTAEMTTNSTFIDAGWDFDTIWALDYEFGIINDGYPYFGWAVTTPPETGYTLTLSSTDGGNVTDPGEGAFDYSYGTVVSLNTTADSGYRFALWIGDISEVADTHDATTIVTVTGDFSIMAIFVPEGELTLYITSTDGGNVTDPGEGLFSYNASTVVDLEATAEGGYGFVLWTGDTGGIFDTTASTTTVTMLDDYAITANFVSSGNYALVISSTEGGEVLDPGEGLFEYAPSTVVNLTAQPNLGAWFTEWTGDIGTISDVYNPITNITVDGNYSIVAEFDMLGSFNLTISSSEGGNVTMPGEGSFVYPSGTVVPLEAVAEGQPSTSYSLAAYYVYPAGSSGSPENYPEWEGNVTTYVEYEADLITAYVQANNVSGSMSLVSVEAFEMDSTYFSGGTLKKTTLIDALKLLPSWADSDLQVIVGSWDAGTNAEAVGVTTTFMYLTTIEADVKAMEGTPGYEDRVYCEMAHEFGHIFGCGHCSDKPCPMAQQYITYTEWVDMGQTLWFCEAHQQTFLSEWQQKLSQNEPQNEVEYTFIGWTGDVGTIANAMAATTNITMNGDYVIVANFAPTDTCNLLTNVNPVEGGNITTPGMGVFTFPCGSLMSITAQAYEDWWFEKWTGDITNIANPLSFNTTIWMLDNYAITANFVEELPPGPGAPTVVTGNATSITATRATLHGALTDLGSYTPIYVFMQYGLTTSYGTNTPLQVRVSTGNFAAAVIGLISNTTYHYRAAAMYDTGLYVYGDDETFVTTSGEYEEPEGYEYYNCEDIWMYEAYRTGDNETAVVYGADWFFETFTPVQAFKISSVRLKILRVGSPGALTVSVRNVNESGEPTGPDLTSASYSGTGPSVGWYEISLPEYRLETKTYALAVRAVGGDASNYVGWRYDGAGNYTGGSWGTSSSSGVAWTLDSDKDFLFETYGTTVLCILDVKVFSSFLKSGDWLIAVHYLNEFPPYYSNGDDVTNLFNLQLMSDSIVIARIRLPMWGFMPASIYLSPELASTLEWGRNYEVVMKGRFSPYPMATWTLTPEDWLGSDLTRLDTWVLGIADKMTQYYETDMTVYTENKKVLNDEGGVFFSIGIPMLANVRPHLFLNPGLWTSYNEEEWRQLYEDELTLWREAFGPKIVEDADTVGFLFNLQGNQVATAVFIGAWVVVGIGVGAVAGAAVLIASIPFLIIGLLGGLIPKPLAAILAAVFLLVFVLYTWFNRG